MPEVDGNLTMREVVARTGVEAATLRMWEQRYGFPVPQRTPSGHRRYSERDVRAIEKVNRRRGEGLELRAAIENARSEGTSGPPGERDSIYAGLRRSRPDLHPYVLPKHALVRMSHAIEDECMSSAAGALLFASFQQERFYRLAEDRWRDLSASAREALVFADFAALSQPDDGPAEIPISRSDPAGREWSIVCDAPDFTAMLAAWERPGQNEIADADRSFEVLWSLEPELARNAAHIATAIAQRPAPEVTERFADLLADPPGDGPRMECVVALTNRMVAYVAGAS